MADEILFFRPHADAPLAAAALVAVRRDRSPLDVAGVADRDRHVFFGDQVLDAQFARLAFDNLGPPIVAVFRPDVAKFVDDDLHQQALAGQDGAEPLDRFQELGELVQDLLTLQPGQPLKLHIQDGLRLNLREAEGRHQPFAGFGRRLGRPDQRDHRIEVIERDLQPFQDVIAGFGFPEFEFGSPADDLAAELNEALNELQEVQHLRPPADDGEHDDAETRLQRGVFVEVVENDVGHFAALQLDDDAHAFAVRLVAEV